MTTISPFHSEPNSKEVKKIKTIEKGITEGSIIIKDGLYIVNPNWIPKTPIEGHQLLDTLKETNEVLEVIINMPREQIKNLICQEEIEHIRKLQEMGVKETNRPLNWLPENYLSSNDKCELLMKDTIKSTIDNDIHTFESGAVRSKDVDGVAYHLISPVALANITLHIFDWDKYTSISLLDGALHHAYNFLGGEKVNQLAYATICTMAAQDTIGTFIYNPLQYWNHHDYNHKFHLLPFKGFRSLAETYKEGSIKYGDYNWERGMPITDLLNHAIAHIFNYFSGDRSENHLGHATWNFQAAIHSYMQWPELNKNLRNAGCMPPLEIKTNSND